MESTENTDIRPKLIEEAKKEKRFLCLLLALLILALGIYMSLEDNYTENFEEVEDGLGSAD